MHSLKSMVAVQLLAAVFALSPFSSRAADTLEQKNMELVGHSDLDGNGDGGEGMAIQQWPDGRRILYIAHEGQKTCLSIVDVTHPEQPVMINQLPSPQPNVTRCNSLGLSGNVLVVANQAKKVGQNSAGLWVLDVSDFARLQSARKLQDLSFSFFDTSGPASPGAHYVWFVDGQFAHLTTGTRDSRPTNPKDNQFYIIVDLRDPKHPREVARWWLPGTQQGDVCLPGCLPERHKIDDGYRSHTIEVFPDHPDRAYVGYIDGGQLILDISGLEDVRAGRATNFTPKLVSRLKFSPPYTAWTHSVQPIFERGLAFVSDESVQDACADAPKTVWLVDIRAETNPVIIATAPFAPNAAELCKRGGRYGSHNLSPNFPGPTSAKLKNSVVATFFNGGVRVFHLADTPGVTNAPPHIEEVGYFIPPTPPNNPTHAIAINHAIVDEHGLIYAVDRETGGLYIIKYTGSEPLN